MEAKVSLPLKDSRRKHFCETYINKLKWFEFLGEEKKPAPVPDLFLGSEKPVRDWFLAGTGFRSPRDWFGTSPWDWFGTWDWFELKPVQTSPLQQ
nr:hypothetical protein Iba_chr03bCG12410 [Ipomoea batatas]